MSKRNQGEANREARIVSCCSYADAAEVCFALTGSGIGSQARLNAPSNMKTSISINHSRPLPLLSKAGWFVIAVALFAINNLPIRADLVAHWTFDEAGGTVAHDSAGGLDGTLSPAGAGFVAGGISSNAVSLSQAANGFVNMGNVLPLTSGDFSVVA